MVGEGYSKNVWKPCCSLVLQLFISAMKTIMVSASSHVLPHTDMQEQCPKCVIDKKTGVRSECSSSWRDENRDLNLKIVTFLRRRKREL